MQKLGIFLLALLLLLFSTHAIGEYADDEYTYSDNSYSDYSYSEGSEDYQDEAPAYFPEDDGYQPEAIANDDFEKAYPRKKAVHELNTSYASRLPSQIPAPGERLIVIDPHVHAWGAYMPDGKLMRAGLATAGGKWCNDVGRSCRTKVGSFRIFSLGDSDCVSTLYPLGEGGAPMPYCMFFNGNQGLHGSNQVTEGNISHGCVRVSVRDAAWLRFEFANKGTRVDVKPY